jgi:hypothetical protein
MKLAVTTPWTSPFMWTGYVDAMLNLERPAEVRNPLTLGRAEPLETRFFRGSGWSPAKRHLNGVEQALAWGADLICIVGADQVHPPDMLRRLVARWEQGCEVISALVPARAFIGWQDMRPFQPMAWRLKRGASVDIDTLNLARTTTNQIEVIDPAAGELQQVNFIGSGVLMFHRDHLAAMARPWFSELFDPVTYDRTASMDTRFVWRLQEEAGATVWVDTTIKVRHLHAFEIDESFQDRFNDWRQPGVGDPQLCRFRDEAPAGVPETAVV